MVLSEPEADLFEEYCHSETFSKSCPSHDEVIIIRRAEYGRMRVGRCVHDSAYVGCRISVLTQLDRMCSGRPSCQVPLPNPVLDAVDPCLVSTVKSYLQVAADCQKGTSPVQYLKTKTADRLESNDLYSPVNILITVIVCSLYVRSICCRQAPITPNSSLSQFLSSIVTLIPSGLPSRILTCTELKGHWLCLF